MPRAAPPAPGSRRRNAVFSLLTVVMGALTGLAAVEAGLRYYRGLAQSREQMDPGFLAYDSTLGWRMTPDWSGRHVHQDFDVRYTVGPDGLRSPAPPPGARSRVAFLGDSFTFGLGVNDQETFVERLNGAATGTSYLNAGIAGYSTDQQLLYLRERLPAWRLDRLVLVVYLGNDLLDNALRFPLQAEMGKPLFVPGPGGLELRNVPVPRVPKPQDERSRTLASEVLGREPPPSWRNQWELTRALGLAETADPKLLAGLPERLAGRVDLFIQLVAAMETLCATQQVPLTLALMPGRSYVVAPDSLSAAFQAELRRQILARQAELGVPVIDLAARLRDRYAGSGVELFHPREGHLNPMGHRVVAELLASPD